MKYGYVRVSTKDQNDDRQVISLKKSGVTENRIFVDKQSGKDFNRPKYKSLIKKLKAGDCLVIKSIDRLGRNYAEILEQWRYLTKIKKVNIIVLDMPLLNTEGEKDLTNTLISEIVLQLLSYVAETEREFIRQRQAEGIAAAKARGVHFGRLEKERPENYGCVLQMWSNKEISAREAGRRLSVTHNTFLKWAHNDDTIKYNNG